MGKKIPEWKMSEPASPIDFGKVLGNVLAPTKDGKLVLRIELKKVIKGQPPGPEVEILAFVDHVKIYTRDVEL